MPVVFNGITRQIEITDVSITSLDVERDIYSEWKDWSQIDDNSKYASALRSFGGDPTITSQFAPKYFFLQNYWRVLVNNGNVVSVGLNLYTEDYDSPYLVIAGSGVSDRNSDAVSINNELIEFASFQNGVWLKPTSSNTGTVFPVGSPTAPVNNLADAKLIAIDRGFVDIYLQGIKVVETTESLDDLTFSSKIGTGTLILTPGCSTNNTLFKDIFLTGELNGNISATTCGIGNITGFDGILNECFLSGNITIAGTGLNLLANCVTDLYGVNIMTIDMAGTGHQLLIRDCTGDFKIINMTDASELVDMDVPTGTVEIDSTVSAGVINVRGIVEPIDNSTGTAIINFTSTINNDNISSAVWNETLTGASHNIPTSAGRRLRDITGVVITTGDVISSTINTLTLNGNSSSVDGAYDPAFLAITSGIGFGQSRLILEYNGATKTAVLDRDWKTLPDNTSEYTIYADPGREHVNEGLLTSATSTTSVLNLDASNLDEVYSEQLLFIRSGLGADQVRIVKSYNGSTRTITVHKPWGIIPDDTSAYVILPLHEHTLTEIHESVKMQEIHQALMLDPANPVTTNENSITFGDVEIDLVGDPNVEIIGTRKP